MFNTNAGGAARVNGHVPSLAGGQEMKSDQRKRKGKAIAAMPLLGGPLASSHRVSNASKANVCNGQLKFADRLKGLRGLLLSNGENVFKSRVDSSDLSDMEDPYAFNEPEPVRRYSTSGSIVKSVPKSAPRGSMKSKNERGSNSSAEPTGLNMTRLYPELFEPKSSQIPSSSSSSTSGKTTLASLLESSISDDHLPKRNDLDRTFSAFSAKDFNCFPNLTSPPPPEQPSPSVISNTKVSPVKHGMPTTPQRESNKLAALFSPTYVNSIRNDKTKSRRFSNARNQARDKVNSRTTPCDKKVKEVTIKSVVGPSVDVKRAEDATKTTLNRLQDKIARKMVLGKQQRKLVARTGNEITQRRHSVNDVPVRRERSLLEEQLLGPKSFKSQRKDDSGIGYGAGISAHLTPPPSATTRVPGVSGPLTYGIAKSFPTSSRANNNTARKEKTHATYSGVKASRMSVISSLSVGKNVSLLRQGANACVPVPPYLQMESEMNRSSNRLKYKMDRDPSKHDSLQRLYSSRETKHDVFTRTRVVETDSDDSDLDEGLIYQKHWFSGWMEAGSGLAAAERREGRLAQIKNEFRRKLSQVWGARCDPTASPLPKCVIDAALTKPSQTALLLSPNQRLHRIGRSKLSMLVPKRCVFGREGEGELCNSPALPCAHHCVRHITYNVEQLLFEHCTAKFSDNTQCCVPVFDSSHELPLCSEHARKLDDYNRLSQVLKPKRVRKKSKPSAMTRSTKRNKKKKSKSSQISHQLSNPLPSPTLSETLPPLQAQARIQRSQSLPVDSYTRQESEDCSDGNAGSDTRDPLANNVETFVANNSFTTLNSQMNGPERNGTTEPIVDVAVDAEEEEALELAVELPELGEASDLAQPDASLLEEHDLTNVLNEIPTIAFTDLFGDKDKEPTREETEELERALAAVTKDVKSLQTMGSLLDYKTQDILQPNQSQTQAQVFLEVDKLSPSQGLLDIQGQGLIFDEKNAHGLLDNFLDDQELQTLTAQLPNELPSTSSGLVYYQNGYALNGGTIDKSVCVSNTNATSVYQSSNMVGVPLPTQTDLHS